MSQPHRSADAELLEIIDIPDWDGPLPTGDALAREYFAACAEGRLLLQECPRCGHRQHYPRALCTRCAATPQWLQARGGGEIYSFSVVRQMGTRPFSRNAPYVLALVDLDEGPRLLGTVLECELDEVEIGRRVHAVIHRIAPDLGIPQWRMDPPATPEPAGDPAT